MSGYEVKILFGSIMFYMFIGFMLSIGGSQYLNASVNIPEPAIIQETGNPLWDFFNGTFTNLTNFISIISAFLFNPFSAISYLSWFSIALMFTNIYIIARLVRGGG